MPRPRHPVAPRLATIAFLASTLAACRLPNRTQEPTTSPTAAVDGVGTTATMGPDAGNRGIPGLTFDAIRDLAGDEGLTCTEALDPYGPYCTKQIGSARYELAAVGSSTAIVQSIRASIVMTNGADPTDQALPFLSKVAGIGFEGADSHGAVGWVRSNIGSANANSVVGPVQYVVRWPPSTGAAYLDIQAIH